MYIFSIIKSIKSGLLADHVFLMYLITSHKKRDFWTALSRLPIGNLDIKTIVSFTQSVTRLIDEMGEIMYSQLSGNYPEDKSKNMAKSIVIEIVQAIIDRDADTLKTVIVNGSSIAAIIFMKITDIPLPVSQKDIALVIEEFCRKGYGGSEDYNGGYDNIFSDESDDEDDDEYFFPIKIN